MRPDARLMIAMLPIAIIVGCAVAAAHYWFGWFTGLKW
jgi:hypothetical protein